MRKDALQSTPDCGNALGRWRVGARVFRDHTDVSGTIVEMTGHVKVKWDSGRTSYYRPGTLSAVRLKPPQEQEQNESRNPLA